MSFQACSGVRGWVYLNCTDLTMQENARLKNTSKNTPCVRYLNWQTCLPPGKQNLQVQSFWCQESNPELLMSVFTIPRPPEAALQVKFKTSNKVLTSWMLFLDVQKMRDFSLLSFIHNWKTCTPSSALIQLLHKDYLFQLQLNLSSTQTYSGLLPRL